MLTSMDVRNTPEPTVYSENYHKQDSASAEPEIKTWNGRGIFKNEAPVTVFSRNDHNIHFNTKLEFCITNEPVSECNPEQQPAIRMDNGNPFIRFFGFKDEEAVDDAISFLNLPKQHKLTEPEDIQSDNINQSLQYENSEEGIIIIRRFLYENMAECFLTPCEPNQLKCYPLAQKIQALSIDIGSPLSLHVNRHFHTTPIDGDLPPHEDPPVCKPGQLPDTGIGQQHQEVALNCDYLFTTVRHVDKESVSGHLCIYLAPKGLGNADINSLIISRPRIADNVNSFIMMHYWGNPIALRLLRIDDKPGAGYAINQNAEYVFDVQKDSSGNTNLICRNKENPCQVLFRGKLSSDSIIQIIITRSLNKEDEYQLPVYKVLHGYETEKGLQPTFARPTADDKEEPGIKRDILIGRLSVVPKEEELPAFYEKKSTEYKLGGKVAAQKPF